MPNYACNFVNSSGTLTERSISAKSMGERYQSIDRNGERLISAKKPGLNLSLDMDINQLLGREVKAKALVPKDLSMFTRQLEMLLNTGIPMLDALNALEEAAVSENLKKEKIFFAGIDFIDQKLNGDINVTSPTGLKTLYDLSGINLAKLFWKELKA